MSVTEFHDVSQIELRMEVTRQFPFVYSDGSRLAVIASNDGIGAIFEISHLPSSEQPFHMAVDIVKPSSTRTVVEIQDVADLMFIYNKAGLLERQFLLLDPVYANVLAIEPLEPCIVHLSMSPTNPKWKFDSPIAIVTNGGVCEIRTKRNNIRNYDHELVNISKVWEMYCRPNRPEKFDGIESLVKYFSDLVITVSCWPELIGEQKHWSLYCGTVSGLIVAFGINDTNGTVQFTYKTGMGKIVLLKFFTYQKKQKTVTLLFAASTNGLLKSFLIDQSGRVVKSALIWALSDKMVMHSLDITYSEEMNQIVVATSKGSHFLVFFLSPSGDLMRKASHYVGNLSVTGIQRLDSFQYIVCSLSSYTQNLRINHTSKEIEITAVPIKNELDTKCYQVLGMVTTRNKVGWLFLQFPTKLYEHSFRNPTVITVSVLNELDPLATLVNRTDLKIYELADCAEVIRCVYLKHGLTDIYSDFDLNADKMNDVFMRKLKIWSIILSGKLGSYRQKVRTEDTIRANNELLNIRKVISVGLAYKRLSRLATLQQLSSVQKISGVYFRKKMLDFCKDDTLDWMRRIRQTFVPLIENLLHRTEEWNQAECEKCVYCDEYINLESGMCKDEHKVPRCCITFLQVPLFCARACSTCKYAAIDDETLLKQILCNDESISCPLCDAPLTRANSELYLR